MSRPYANVIVWSGARRRAVEFYVLLPSGKIREIKRHRTVKEETYVRRVTNALRNGLAVTFEICDSAYRVTQRANFQRTEY